MSLIEPRIGRSRPARLRVKSVELDTVRRRITVGGQLVDLSETAYMALEVLVLHSGTTLNSQAIVDYVFNDDVQDPRIIAVIMFRISRALAQAGAPDLIATVLGEGYRVNAPGDCCVDAVGLLPIGGGLRKRDDDGQAPSASAGPSLQPEKRLLTASLTGECGPRV